MAARALALSRELSGQVGNEEDRSIAGGANQRVQGTNAERCMMEREDCEAGACMHRGAERESKACCARDRLGEMV